VYGNDRVFIHLQLGADDDGVASRLAALEKAGHPVIRIRLPDEWDLGQEFFRWEVAVAAAGAVLGIHPFNQPDVELAKQLARQAMAQSGSAAGSVETVSARDRDLLKQAVSSWLGCARPADYIGIQAYLTPTTETASLLQPLQRSLRDKTRLAATLGYGPRFLHSTGQLHKGGPNTGYFLQLVDEPARDVPVPESSYTFGSLIRAQSLGDYQALRQRGQHVLRVNLGTDATAGLTILDEVIHA
jgi:transaldolase / glucose-6-phosphate isomerase